MNKLNNPYPKASSSFSSSHKKWKNNKLNFYAFRVNDDEFKWSLHIFKVSQGKWKPFARDIHLPRFIISWNLGKTVSKTNETSLGMTFHWLWDNFAWRFFVLDTETPWHIKLFPGILEQNILKTHMTLKTSKHWSFTQTYLWRHRKHHFMFKLKTASTLLWLRWCIILCTY